MATLGTEKSGLFFVERFEQIESIYGLSTKTVAFVERWPFCRVAVRGGSTLSLCLSAVSKIQLVVYY